jgi:hypothetical protein
MPGSGTTTALENLETSFHQDLNGDGVIGVPAATAPATPTHALQVTLANNDTFLFRSDLGGVDSNITSTGSIGSNEHLPLEDNESSVFFHNVQATLETLQTPLQMTAGGNDTVTNGGGHNSATPSDIHFGGLHASGFFFH